jgi:hypothetical protein
MKALYKGTLFACLHSAAWCAGPTLSPSQIAAAIERGSGHKSIDKYLEKGLVGKRIKLAGAMSRDGISKYVTLYNDFQAVAAESAAAHQQMRDLKPDDVQSSGLLHAFVEVQGGGIVGVARLDRGYQGGRAHLVLKIGDRVLQPLDKSMLKQANQAGATLMWGATMRKITLQFSFDVTPEDLRSPIEIVLIDGDGNRHTGHADLDGVLNLQ